MPLQQRVIGRVRNLEPVPSDRPRDACQHRWVIEPANGNTASGTCRVCGQVKEFPTAWLDIAPSARDRINYRRKKGEHNAIVRT